MSKGILPDVYTEGHVKAVKDNGDFGGGNMWHLYVKDTSGRFVNVQWMNVQTVQAFFTTPLPVYRLKEGNRYELVK